MDWDPDKCLRLINEYKTKENLWNTRHTAYYNRHQKEAAWQEIADQFGSSAEELKKKIDSLKGSYRREKARTKKRIRTRNGEYKQYESRWFAYKALQFLNIKDDNDAVQKLEEDMTNYRYYKTMGKENVNVKIKPGVVPHIFHCQKDDKAEQPTTSRGAFEKRKRHEYISDAISSSHKKPKPRDKMNNIEIKTKSDEESEVLDDSFDEDRDPHRERIDDESIDLLPTPVAEVTLNENVKKERLKATKLRSKNKKSDEDPRISEAFRCLKEATATVRQQKDQCSAFGEYIAEKLRTFDRRLRAIAQHNISNVLFELEMGVYQNSDENVCLQSSVPLESLESNNQMDVPATIFMEELDLSPKSEPHSPTPSHSSHG